MRSPFAVSARDIFERRPELPVLAVAVAAWVVLLSQGATPSDAPPMGAHVHHHGMAMGGSPKSAGVFAVALMWVAMCVAMMLPLTAPDVRHVSSRVPRRGRVAAVAVFCLAFLAVWMPGAVLAVASPASAPIWVGSVAFAAAAGWELLAVKRTALLRCHRRHVVRAGDPERLRSCGAAGASRGIWCVASCGPAMVALMLTGHAVVPLVGVTGIIVAQQFRSDAHWYRNWSAGAFVLIAAGLPLIGGP